MSESRIKRRRRQTATMQSEVQKVSDALGDTGRILVRPSGTEPLIRVMVEAPTDEICGKYVAQVVEMIEKRDWQSKT